MLYADIDPVWMQDKKPFLQKGWDFGEDVKESTELQIL